MASKAAASGKTEPAIIWLDTNYLKSIEML